MIVGYVRLSVRDKENNYSSSIINQIEIIKSYSLANNYKLDKIYVDDGCSGINYDRLGFLELKKDIEDGNITTLIVKDMSRLGREVYESSFYITEYFKMHKVRFIAIDDYYDSNVIDNDIIVNLKSLINDNYVKDSSMKRRQVALNKTLNHEFLGPYAPFGYKITYINNLRTLKIDFKQALIVKKIFMLKSTGMSIANIVDFLNNFDDCYWNYKKVLRIVKNRVYMGDLVVRKTEKIDYRVKKRKYLPSSKQEIIENVFPAIIDSNLFNKANKWIKSYTNHLTLPSIEGKYVVICNKCLDNMHFYRRYRNKRPEYYYKCLKCFKTVFESRLEKIVKKSFDQTISSVDKYLVINNVFERLQLLKESKKLELDKKIQQKKAKLKELYLMKVNSKISLDEFKLYKQKLETELLESNIKFPEIDYDLLDKLYNVFLLSLECDKYVEDILFDDKITITYNFFCIQS